MRPNGELPSDPQQTDRQAPTRNRRYAKARLAVHHRSANLIVGDGTKNGFPAPNKELQQTKNDHLTGKTPYKFESTSLQRRVSCEPDRDLGRNAPRHTRFKKANCVPCDISISLLTSPDRSGKTSESAENATQRAHDIRPILSATIRPMQI